MIALLFFYSWEGGWRLGKRELLVGGRLQGVDRGVGY